MSDIQDVDVCVIGGGSGGLSIAAGAAQLGARTVLVERHKMGGDCLNYGCVPSKALLAAGRAAHALGRGAPFGVAPAPAAVDFARVHAHVQGVIAEIAPVDSVERYRALGVEVVSASAKFVGRREIEAGGRRIRAKWFAVATGSRAGVPPIPGLADVPHLTNETIFDLAALPRHLIVIGGGPIGCEMAQAFRQLGVRVSVLEVMTLLGKDDPEAAEIVRRRLRRDGVEIREGIRIARIDQSPGGIDVRIEHGGKAETVSGSHVLVAAGRIPNVEGLGLEQAGIIYSKKGIQVDARLRSSNKRVFAVGDVAGGYQFTHIAGYHAGIVIRNALFRLPAKVDYRAVPWVTYTDPQLAQVGLNESDAKTQHGEISVLRWPYRENDRAQAERTTDGFVKVLTTRRGHILGATSVGADAGDLLLPWALAIQNKLKIGAMAGV
ncbi:MAG: NAD(P)/FAD-dependent oxidoreductase, partial [Alphaproteobacteria bacterium]